MPRRQITIPGSYYKLQKQKSTTFLMNKQNGQMRGRRAGPDDGTRALTMVKPFDVNKDGDTTDAIDLQIGQKISRVSSPSKPSKVVIIRHWRKDGSQVRAHTRNL